MAANVAHVIMTVYKYKTRQLLIIYSLLNNELPNI